MGFDQPRVQSTLPAVDYETFFDIVHKAFNLYLDEEQVPVERRPVLVREYPKDRQGKFDHNFDVIVYQICYARLSGTDPSGTNRVPRTPLQREDRPHPEKKHYRQIIYGWWEDVTAEFVSFSKTPLEASRLATMFHRFIMRYAHGLKYFKAHGVDNFKFLERADDKTTRDFGQELSSRSLKYQFRLNFQEVYEAKTLEVVEVSLNGNEPMQIDARDDR